MGPDGHLAAAMGDAGRVPPVLVPGVGGTGLAQDPRSPPVTAWWWQSREGGGTGNRPWGLGVTVQPSIPPHRPAQLSQGHLGANSPPCPSPREPVLGQIIRVSVKRVPPSLKPMRVVFPRGFGVIATVRVPLSPALGGQWLSPCLFAEV